MKCLMVVLSLFFLSFGQAYALKPCEELKAEIAEKIDAKGVPSYDLTILGNAEAEAAEGEIVGSCDGGINKIVYLRHDVKG